MAAPVLQARSPSPGQRAVASAAQLVFEIIGAPNLADVLINVTWPNVVSLLVWQSDAATGGWSGTRTPISGGHRYALTPPAGWPADVTCEARVRAQDAVERLLAVSNVGKQLYIRRAAWEAFSPQPTWGAGSAAKICLGLPNGNIITNRRTGGSEWCHYSAATATWSYKAKVQVGGGTEVHGFVYDSTHVYVAEDNARVDKFDGADWSTLTASALSPVSVGPYHVAATAADRVWCATGGNGYDAANSSLLYFDGSTWANRISEARTALGLNYRAYVTQLHAVGGVLYCGWADYYEDGGIWYTRVSKLVGSTWSLLGSGYMSQTIISEKLTGLFAISESSVWALGTNNTAKMVVAHWNGTAWSSQSATTDTLSNTLVAQQIFGTPDGLQLLAVEAVLGPRLETTNGTTWAAPAWPDGNTVQSVGCALELGDILDKRWTWSTIMPTQQPDREYCLDIGDDKDLSIDAEGRLVRDYTVASRCRMRLMTTRGAWPYDAEMGSRFRGATTEQLRARAQAIATEALQPLIDEGSVTSVSVGEIDTDEYRGTAALEVRVTVPGGSAPIPVGTYRMDP